MCKPDLYEAFFKQGLKEAFGGNDSLRPMLLRLIDPRNSLSHANPISVHDAYRALCYSGDVLQSLKKYYSGRGMAQQYNVPTILRVRDSFGHVTHMATRENRVVDFSNNPPLYLTCGERLSLEVEVDPSFDASEYDVRWSAMASVFVNDMAVGHKFALVLEPRHVSTQLTIQCTVISHKPWHKEGAHDDILVVYYRVLPPP